MKEGFNQFREEAIYMTEKELEDFFNMADEDKDGKKYQAILARGDSMNSVPPTVDNSNGAEFGSGHTHGTPQDCPTPVDDGTLSV